MIKIDQALDKSLRSYFGKVAVLEDGLLRCERVHNQSTLEVHYIDCTESFLKSDFNLDNYTEKLVAPDYYNNPSDLQWNYYLTFLSSKNVQAQSDFQSIRRSIESNRSFVRKGILTIDELEEWLSFFGTPKKVKNPTNDLSTTWLEELRSKKLDGIFLGYQFKEIADAYCSGNPILEPQTEPEGLSRTANVDLGYLKRVILNNYRSHPAPNDYEVGTVTLVTGPNGSGKTSFLEAIELGICGKSFRNKSPEQTADIKLVWSSGVIDYNEPNETKKFRNRDSEWYGNVYSKGNDLVNRFNRFNFHDTDAAYRLSSEEHAENIKEILVKLTLGEAVNDLAKKIEGTLKAFELKQKGYSSAISRDRNEISRLNEVIQKLQTNISEPSGALVSVQKKLKGFSWLGFIPESPKTSALKTLEQLNAAQTILEKVDKIDFLDATVNFSKIEKFLHSIEGDLKVITDSNLELTKNDSEIKKREIDSANKKKFKILLERALAYLKQENLREIILGDKSLSEISERLEKLTKIAVKTNELDLNDLKNSDLTVSDWFKKATQAQNDLNTKIKTLTEQVEQIKSHLGKVESILSDLRIKGLAYAKEVPHLENCPVCAEETSSEKIKTHLSKTNKPSVSSTQQTIDPLLKEIESLTEKSTVLARKRKLAEVALHFTEDIMQDDCKGNTISEIKDILLNIPSEIATLKSKMDSLRESQKEFKDAGFSKTEYDGIFSNLSLYFDTTVELED